MQHIVKQSPPSNILMNICLSSVESNNVSLLLTLLIHTHRNSKNIQKLPSLKEDVISASWGFTHINEVSPGGKYLANKQMCGFAAVSWMEFALLSPQLSEGRSKKAETSSRSTVCTHCCLLRVTHLLG